MHRALTPALTLLLWGLGPGSRVGALFKTTPLRVDELPPGVTTRISLKSDQTSAYAKFFDDPYWPSQWYLHDYRTELGPVMDHNVVPVFKKGFAGQEVTVAIVSTGIEAHEDLQESYDKQRSKTCEGSSVHEGGLPDYPRTYRYATHKQGTRLAGIIGMANNKICGVGIARKAKLISIRTDKDADEATLASALTYDINIWDVISVGHYLLYKEDLDVYKALTRGSNLGREGKGSIYVVNAGLDSPIVTCWIDPWVNHPDTFPIGSATQKGKVVKERQSFIKHRCAGIIATAYRSWKKDEGMVTTDMGDGQGMGSKCTNTFKSPLTSSSIGSGIIALVLSANKELTSRDVRHLIVAGSEVAPLADNKDTWSKNAAGFWFSNDFGFGLLNAENMVELALKWNSVPEQHVCVIQKNLWMSKKLPIKKEVEVTFDRTDGCKGTDHEVLYLENIELDITINYHKTFWGDTNITLVSGQGTSSTILYYYELNLASNKPLVANGEISTGNKPVDRTRRIKSYRYWGESPRGTWRLKAKLEGVGGSIKNMKITMYGTQQKPSHYRSEPPFRGYSAFRMTDGTVAS